MKKSTLAITFLALLFVGCSTEVTEDKVVLMQADTADASCPPPAACQNAMTAQPQTGCPMMTSAETKCCTAAPAKTQAECPLMSAKTKTNCPIMSAETKTACPKAAVQPAAAEAAAPSAADAAM